MKLIFLTTGISSCSKGGVTRFDGASRVETVRASHFHGRITGTSSHSDMICN